MSTIEQAQIAPATVARDLTTADLWSALAAGWNDFRAYPIYGLFFSSIFVAAGLFLYYALFTRGEVLWVIPAAAGFPILAPFVATGLYEVSRRREAGIPMKWSAVLGALRGRGDEQLIMMGALVFVAFSVWIGLAHGIYAIFTANLGATADTLDLFRSGPGIMMLLVGGSIGALIALALYSITVISLPMLVDRDVDFITAIIVSLATIRSNTFVMLSWAIVIAISLAIAMVPAFLGLLVALPVLGHATWHLYRRSVSGSAGQFAGGGVQPQ